MPVQASRVATRYAASLVTPKYVEAVLKGLDQGNAPDAARRLQGLARSLRGGGLDPFPVAELEEYLHDRGVPEDELELVRKVRVRAPREKAPGPDFTDAYLKFGRETGASVVFDARVEHDPNAGKSVLEWLAGYSKLKPLAKKVWDQAVRKVHLGKPQGTEDAAWQSGGKLFLDVTRTHNVRNCVDYITHELGHAFEGIHHIGGFDPPWGQPPFITAYVELRPNVEDVAECFRVFVNEPRLLKSKCPEKYEILKGLV